MAINIPKNNPAQQTNMNAVPTGQANKIPTTPGWKWEQGASSFVKPQADTTKLAPGLPQLEAQGKSFKVGSMATVDLSKMSVGENRLDSSRYPLANTEACQQWVDKNKPGLDPAVYQAAQDTMKAMPLPPGFDVAMLGPSRHHPPGTFEVAVKLPNGNWEQNAYAFKNGIFTQVSNLEPEKQSLRPDDLKGAAFTAGIAVEPEAIEDEVAVETAQVNDVAEEGPAEAEATVDAESINVRPPNVSDQPIPPGVLQNAAWASERHGLNIEVLGVSTVPGDKYQNFELVVNGKKGTYLNDNGLFVNRNNDKERLNGRSPEVEAQAEEAKQRKEQEKADNAAKQKNTRINNKNKEIIANFDSDE